MHEVSHVAVRPLCAITCACPKACLPGACLCALVRTYKNSRMRPAVFQPKSRQGDIRCSTSAKGGPMERTTFSLPSSPPVHLAAVGRGGKQGADPSTGGVGQWEMRETEEWRRKLKGGCTTGAATFMRSSFRLLFRFVHSCSLFCIPQDCGSRMTTQRTSHQSGLLPHFRP